MSVRILHIAELETLGEVINEAVWECQTISAVLDIWLYR